MVNHSQEELMGMLFVRHPILTHLRQIMIMEMIEAIDQKLRDGLGEEAFYEAGVLGVVLRGSATIPPNLRRAGDADIEPFLGVKYSRRKSQKAFRDFLRSVGEVVIEHGYEIVEIRDRKYEDIMTFCLAKDFSLEEINRRINLKGIDNITAEDLKGVFAKRDEMFGREGAEYPKTDIEKQAKGITIVAGIDINLNPTPNLFNPRDRFGNPTHIDRGLSPFQNALLFLLPHEEVAIKLLAALTPKRSGHNERLTKDLIDIHLRTSTIGGKKPGEELKEFATYGLPEFRTYSGEPLLNFLAVALRPNQPDFSDSSLLPHFSAIDPDIGHNRKRVRQGLEKLSTTETLRINLYADRRLEEMSDGDTAKMLLSGAWEEAQNCFGVRRAADHSNRNPKYEVEKEVEDFWKKCAEIKKGAREQSATSKLPLWQVNKQREIEKHLRKIYELKEVEKHGYDIEDIVPKTANNVLLAITKNARKRSGPAK